MNLGSLNKFFSKKSKGQFSIEFLVAFIIFTSVLLYLSFQIAGSLPELRRVSDKNVRLSKGHRIMQSLVETPGHPENWQVSGGVERYGLAYDPQNLSVEKIEEFNETCNENYSSVKESLGLNLTSFRTSIYNVSTGNKILLDCDGGRIPKGVSTNEIQRYAVLENGIMVRMVFEIW